MKIAIEKSYRRQKTGYMIIIWLGTRRTRWRLSWSRWTRMVSRPLLQNKARKHVHVHAFFPWTSMFSARIPWSPSRRLLLVHRPIPFFPLRRCLSTNRLDPMIHHFAADLALKQPTFQVPSHNIRILSEPAQFYDLLLVSFQLKSFFEAYSGFRT